MRRADLVRVVAVLALAGALAGCDRGGEAKPAAQGAPEADATDGSAPPPGTRPLPAGVTPAMAAQARKLYGETCMVCHGPDAAGTQLGPSLRDEEWLEGSGQLPELVRVIREGVPQPQQYPVPMPPYGGGGYTDEEVGALAAYVYSLGR